MIVKGTDSHSAHQTLLQKRNGAVHLVSLHRAATGVHFVPNPQAHWDWEGKLVQNLAPVVLHSSPHAADDCGQGPVWSWHHADPYKHCAVHCLAKE